MSECKIGHELPSRASMRGIDNYSNKTKTIQQILKLANQRSWEVGRISKATVSISDRSNFALTIKLPTTWTIGSWQQWRRSSIDTSTALKSGPIHLLLPSSPTSVRWSGWMRYRYKWNPLEKGGWNIKCPSPSIIKWWWWWWAALSTLPYGILNLSLNSFTYLGRSIVVNIECGWWCSVRAGGWEEEGKEVGGGGEGAPVEDGGGAIPPPFDPVRPSSSFCNRVLGPDPEPENSNTCSSAAASLL